MLSFFFPILDRINDGRFVRQIMVNCLRVFAGIAALAGLAAIIAVLKLAFNAMAPTSVSFAGIVLAALFGASAFCVIQIFLYRSTHIAQLEQGDYIFIGIASHLVRMGGEIVATLFATLGVAAFLAAIVAGSAAGGLQGLLPGPFGMMASSGFGGFVALLIALAIAFVCLVSAYLSAEFLQLFTDVAGDVRRISFVPEVEAAAFPAPMANARICARCGSAIPAGNAFCNECGQPVAKAANA